MDLVRSLPADARRVSVAASRLSRWIQGFHERHGDVEAVATELVVFAQADDGAKAWFDVPFPPLQGDGPPLDALVRHVERTRQVGVLLVRRGGYAAGVFDGTQLIASKVGSSYVQGTTKAGGWSQQRYARRRANQASAAFAEAADAAARVLLPHAGRLDAVVLGGDRPAAESVLSDARLVALTPLVTGAWLSVGDPRLKILQATPEQFLTVRIALEP